MRIILDKGMTLCPTCLVDNAAVKLTWVKGRAFCPTHGDVTVIMETGEAEACESTPEAKP